MCAKQVKKAPAEVKTTGHSWDGIEAVSYTHLNVYKRQA